MTRHCRLPAVLLGLWMMHSPAVFAQNTLKLPLLPAPPASLPRIAAEPGSLVMEAGPKAKSPSLNQKIADTIAGHLRQNRGLHHYQVDISFQDGVVELTGQVADQAQREEVLRIVQGVPGVQRVNDLLKIRGVAGLRAAQAVDEPPPPEPGPLPKPAPGKDNQIQEPAPIFQAVPGPIPGPNSPLPPPRLPPNAWPTYAPYNNYSRVAYPTLYPYQSWPFIGPFYPFPKIPPGWRSISLTWSDGYWWYGKNVCAHDWWRVRYW